MPPFEYWHIPKIWKDGTAFIIGGGPSVSDMDLTPLHSKRVIGVNEAFTLGSWVDVCWFGDCRWHTSAWNRPKMPLREFSGLIVTCCNRTSPMPGVLRVKRGKPEGIETKEQTISWNRNSGASAINLAVHFGVKRIVLLGFDMKLRGEEHNWHDRHESHTPSYERFLKPFPAIAHDLNRLGVECFNATPDSALEVFPKVELEEVL